VSRDEVELEGGWQTSVVRRDDVVLRSTGPQSATVIALLAHLSDEGFTAAPVPIGSGFSNDGREQLSFIEGASPQPLAWTDDAAWMIGDLVRRLHTATTTFVPTVPVWRPWFARGLGGSHPVIGHGDLGPWNILAVADRPVAFIDWDNAGPVDAVWELAQIVWLNAQLHDDDIAELNGLPSALDRARQAALILDGYGLDRHHRIGFVDKMIEFAIRSARDEAHTAHVVPDTVSPAPDGFPLLWAVTWRARAAAWMLDHRTILDNAIIGAAIP
jgi:Phosphotransferase enzyme family